MLAAYLEAAAELADDLVLVEETLLSVEMLKVGPNSVAEVRVEPPHHHEVIDHVHALLVLLLLPVQVEDQPAHVRDAVGIPAVGEDQQSEGTQKRQRHQGSQPKHSIESKPPFLSHHLTASLHFPGLEATGAALDGVGGTVFRKKRE